MQANNRKNPFLLAPASALAVLVLLLIFGFFEGKGGIKTSILVGLFTALAFGLPLILYCFLRGASFSPATTYHLWQPLSPIAAPPSAHNSREEANSFEKDNRNPIGTLAGMHRPVHSLHQQRRNRARTRTHHSVSHHCAHGHHLARGHHGRDARTHRVR